MPSSRDTVLVTGFGPFADYKVNPSWLAVQELSKIGLGDQNMDLVICEMPVIYEHVKNAVPELWEKHKPVLTIHVGVSRYASELTLEQQAFNTNYTLPDVAGLAPDDKSCVADCCEDVIKSCLDMNLVCQDVNESDIKIKAVVSHDPHRYLCGFAYFLSLHKKRECSAFVHVPPLNTPYTPLEVAEGLRVTIKSMLKQIKKS